MVFTYGIDNSEFKEVSKKLIYRYFRDKKFVEFDTETLGFFPYGSDLLCLQLGDINNQVVISAAKVQEFKELLETKILLIHNASFDLKFLYYHNIWPNEVYDTMLAESVIYCGIKLHKKGLAAVSKERIGVDRDKSVRDTIWKEGLTTRVIQYAADDVKDLGKIRESQLKDIDRLDLSRVIELENQFVLVLAYIEFCGFKLDENKWKSKITKDKKLFEERREKLDKTLLSLGLKFAKQQLDLFSDEPVVNVKWSSPKQVISIFKDLGIPTQIVEKGIKKDSVESKHIEKYASKFPIVKDYLEYKEAEKLRSTYGENFLKNINPITKRIHTRYKQVMDTGRISSGSKDKVTKVESPNMQNIPSDKETRACFVADEGNVLIINDYSSQEQVVLANVCLDKNLLEFYDNGFSDMHAFVASKMYDELKGLTFEEIKERFPDKRQGAKIAGFVLIFGGAAASIADQLNVSIEDAQKVYDSYFEAFPGLRSYFDKVKQQGLDLGYILIDEVIGRKSFIFNYEKYKEYQREFTKSFWERWKILKKNAENGYFEEYEKAKAKISEYFKIKGEIERKSLNYPIQGRAANITKKSCILFFDWIKKNNYQNTVKLVNVVHDENNAECPKEMSKLVSRKLSECMVEAGKEYCKRVPLKTSSEISLYWRK